MTKAPNGKTLFIVDTGVAYQCCGQQGNGIAQNLVPSIYDNICVVMFTFLFHE